MTNCCYYYNITMTSIAKALKSLEEDEQAQWMIRGQLLSRQIFTSRREGQTRKLLVLVLVDSDGQLIEVKSWSEKKVYTVYRKFREQSLLLISGSGSAFREPNRKYSKAKCEIYSRWFLTEQTREPVDLTTGGPRNYLNVISDIQKFHLKTPNKPATIVGLLYEFGRGPVRKSRGGYILAQGYYVKLLDERGRMFQVLVWSNVTIEKGRFALNYCNNDDDSSRHENLVLILFAREQDIRYQSRTQGIYTLTSTYPPVVNPQCLRDSTRFNLLKHSLTIENGRSVTYAPPHDGQNQSGDHHILC